MNLRTNYELHTVAPEVAGYSTRNPSAALSNKHLGTVDVAFWLRFDVASHAVFGKKASPVEKINSSWNRRHSISSDHMGAQVKGERQASAALTRRKPPATRQTIDL